MQLSQSGYEALAPLGSMLSCALGVSEIEFAKIKDKGKSFEEKWLEKMFPNFDNESTSTHASEILKRIKKLFDLYELDSSFSIGKKRANQNILNEIYGECLNIMGKRIENELQGSNIQDLEEYKKYQMFYLKKMNVNFKNASKLDGFIFSRSPIIRDIGFCTDDISKEDLTKISTKLVLMADFGFDNSALGKYGKAMVSTNNDKKNFISMIKVPLGKSKFQTMSPQSKRRTNKEESFYAEIEDKIR